MTARSSLALALLLVARLAHAQEEHDPAEVSLGERLFLETRFAQFFAANATDINRPLPGGGDPAVGESETTGASLAGPFAGQSMNCRSCHLVDEQLVVDPFGIADFSQGGVRSYADFARRSPIPDRGDGLTHTPRNSPPLVNASLARRGGVELHFDGEFASLAELVKETLVGRNYGWLPTERKQAMAHVARVIRQDDGLGELASEFGGAYRRVLAGVDERIPEELVLPRLLRIDVTKAGNEQIVNAVSRLVAKYVEQLQFARGDDGSFVGSPFDLFLLRNHLPRRPRGKDTPVEYTRKLAAEVEGLTAPLFVADVDGPFALHDQPFVFDAEELEGLRIFLRTAPDPNAPQPSGVNGGVGNCVACRPAPFFTDFAFHNTGVTQSEYDGVHGAGAFQSLDVPSLAEREADPNAFLPPTRQHPLATGRFRAAADASDSGRADLGAWNVLGNRDFPRAQGRLKQAILRTLPANPGKAGLVDAALARFKTPGLRDLGHSNPYMHDGAFDSLEDVIEFYIRSANAQRAGALRNGAPELAGVELSPADVAPLAAFLRSLNEDYE